jgi:carbamoyltransferase
MRLHSGEHGLVLGINSVFHESSACLFDGARLLAVVEEERLTRVKKAKRVAIDNAHVVPTAAIDYCLRQAGATWAESSHIRRAGRRPVVDESGRH